MVKCRPSDRNKKLSAIKDGFRGKGPFASGKLRRASPRRHSYVTLLVSLYTTRESMTTRSIAKLTIEQMWMPTVVDGKILWKANPKMKPLQRLFDAKPDLDIIESEGQPQLSGGHHNLWAGDLPPPSR